MKSSRSQFSLFVSIIVLALLAACAKTTTVQVGRDSSNGDRVGGTKPNQPKPTDPNSDSGTKSTPTPVPQPSPTMTPAPPLPTPIASPSATPAPTSTPVATPGPTPVASVTSLRFVCAGSFGLGTFNSQASDVDGPSFLSIFDPSRKDRGNPRNPGLPVDDFRSVNPIFSDSESLVFYGKGRLDPYGVNGPVAPYLVSVDLLYRRGIAKGVSSVRSPSSSTVSRARTLGIAVTSYGGSSSQKLVLIPNGSRYDVKTLPPELKTVARIDVDPATNVNPRFIDRTTLLFDSFDGGRFRPKRFEVESTSVGVTVSAKSFPALGGRDVLFPARIGTDRWVFLSYDSGQRQVKVLNERTGGIKTFDIESGVPVMGAATYQGQDVIVAAAERLRDLSAELPKYELKRGEFLIYSLDGKKLGTIPYPDEVFKAIENAVLALSAPIARASWQLGSQFMTTLQGPYGRSVYRFDGENEMVMRLTADGCEGSFMAQEEAR